MSLAPIEGFTTTTVMQMAADIIEENARSLKQCHALPETGDFHQDDFETREQYLHEITLANELRKRSLEIS